MPPLEREATRLRSLIDDADAIIVGIGSGMSSAAGGRSWFLPSPLQSESFDNVQ